MDDVCFLGESLLDDRVGLLNGARGLEVDVRPTAVSGLVDGVDGVNLSRVVDVLEPEVLRDFAAFLNRLESDGVGRTRPARRSSPPNR